MSALEYSVMQTSTAHKVIPSEKFLPFIGQTIAMMRDPVAYIRRRYNRDGEVFRSHLYGADFIQLIGPDANQFVLQNKGNVFSNAGGWEFFIGRFFTRGIMLLDFDEHRWHRQIMQAAFTKKALASYLNEMNPAISRGLAHWRPSKQFQVLPHIKKMTLDIATEVFMGEKLGKEANEINHAFVVTVRAGTALIRHPVPGLLWHKGLKSRARLERFFRERIQQKRQYPGNDLFSQLCMAKTDEGESFSDDDIVNHMIFLLMAAHDTTTITLCSLLYQLAKHPEWQDKARHESLALGHKSVSVEDLEQLSTLGLCMKEALRMIAPVPGMPRKTVKDCEFKGYLIPKGSLVNVFNDFTHHMPEYWTRPEHFDPERFSASRQEHKNHPYQYIPFGGGAHMCIGLHFAEMQVKAIVHQMLQQYRWRLDESYDMPVDYRSLPVPYDGLPVRLSRL